MKITFCTASEIKIYNTIFVSNKASDFGGALYFDLSCNLNLSNDTFKNNLALYVNGGALYFGYL
jgi:predicted outer membrane repeat protein